MVSEAYPSLGRDAVEQFDYIIIGGGTAGCVLAARLSERSTCRVLLIEAGMDTPPETTPEDILDPYPLSYTNPAYRWPLKGHALLASDSPDTALLQARVMGGGSSIMGMIMLRGLPADFDQWAELGATGWSWADVLPWFRTLETDLDFDGPMHGRAGPTEIRRHSRDRWPPIAQAATSFAADYGLPFIADMNGDFRNGYGSLPIAGSIERRAWSAGAYLTTPVRQRPNLTILSRSTARELLWAGTRVVGVRVANGTGTHTYKATETILAMGALLTPHFLLRQGIGAPEELGMRAVPVRHALRGVGRNLQNHAALTIATHIKRDGRQLRPERNHNNSMFRFSSGVPGCTDSDMAIVIGSRAVWHAVAARIAHFAPIVMAPYSRGRVRLRDDHDATPLIEYDLLGDARDGQRLAASIDFLAALVTTLQARRLIGKPVPVGGLAKAGRFIPRTPFNRFATTAIAAATDLLPALGESLVESLAGKGMSWSDIINDPASRDAYVRASISPLAHHAGTCRMGPPNDPDAVVDPSGRVHGVPGLRVADASIMPTVPRGNTNLPTLMLAEKIAGAMVNRSNPPRQIEPLLPSALPGRQESESGAPPFVTR